MKCKVLAVKTCSLRSGEVANVDISRLYLRIGVCWMDEPRSETSRSCL